jgi:hypothetical protein
MDLLNLFRLKREIQRGVSRSDFSDVTEVSSGGLWAVELLVENNDFVALLVDELSISGLAVKATMVFSATTAAPHAELFERVLRGEGGLPPPDERRRWG